MLTPKSWAVHGTQALLTALACTASLFSAQDPPPASIRQPELRRDALIGVDIIPFPGTRLENGVILLRDGVIEAVGTDIEVPAGYRIHDRTGLVAYPGLIEPALLMETTEQATALAGPLGACQIFDRAYASAYGYKARNNNSTLCHNFRVADVNL